MSDINIVGLNESREQTVKDIIKLLDVNDKVACVRYTGYGKSYFIVKKLVDTLNKDTLIVVPSVALVQQYTEMFYGYDNVKIITYQIIKNFSDAYIENNLMSIKYIICDECHHIGNNQWKDEFDRLVKVIKAKVIGLTATPTRGDSINVIDTYFNGVQVEPIDLFKGIIEGYVPKIKYVVAYAEIEDKYNSRFGEVDRYRIKNLLNVPNLMKKYLDEVITSKNIKILVYVPNIKYIKEAVINCNQWFTDMYPNKIINVYNIHSEKQYKQNRDILDKFSKNNKDNTIDIMVSVDMLTEGLHLPTIGVGIMLRKTKSPVTYFQQIGRVINNSQPLVFDLINNSGHIYQMKREYNSITNEIGGKGRVPKVMFDNCIQLFDETKEVLDILYKYRNTNRISDDIRAKIISEDNLTFKQIADKYNVNMNTVANIFKENGIYRNCGVSHIERRQLVEDTYNNHRDLIIKNNGKVARRETANELGLPITVVTQVLEMCDVKPERVWEPVQINKDKAEKFIILKNNKIRKADIQKQLGLSDKEYGAYIRNKDISSRLNKKPRYNTQDIKVWIETNGADKTNRDMANELNIPIEVIRRVVKMYNLPHKVDKVASVITPEIEDEIIKLYKELGSLYAVYKKLGIHKATIKKVVVAHGLEINKPTKYKK